ncbi:MAG: 3-phosphoshikimate 1-carboxyvinyltransferase, partial [Actinomycetota bacterium]|nr:3-phosphoshikimate 1-carboxyvinyltransferase [Actinomycetota bacterium]
MNARFDPSAALRGQIRPPADKSISHRAALIAAMSAEPVRIRNYLAADDTNSTLGAVRALGAIVQVSTDEVLIRGTGLRNAQEAPRGIDVGNAGTLMRLLPGWLAFQPGMSFKLDGDASIRRRPIDRIAEPLRLMGAEIDAHEGRFPPFTVHGAHLHGIEYEMPMASAQVKSCVLIAGLTSSQTAVLERTPSRDHTERMMLRAGAPLERAAVDGSGYRTTIGNADELELDLVEIPGDMSSAAFLIAAGLLVRGSRLLIEGVGVNWTRTGFLRILERMGAIVIGDLESAGAFGAEEPVADLDVSYGPLEGTVVEAEEVPLAIDELPLVALLGCFAEGETEVRGAAELRLKESDRIASVVDGLAGLGADLEATEDGFVVRGTG